MTYRHIYLYVYVKYFFKYTKKPYVYIIMSFINFIPTRETSTVQVAVRVRPLNKREESTEEVLKSRDNSIIVKSDKNPKGRRFTYNYVYDKNTNQKKIFTDIGAHVIHNTYKGYNSTVFAYGQTGSGKTYTMTGIDNDDEMGLIPRICQDLFGQQKNHAGIDQKNCKINYRVEISYMEIYSEKIYDLLGVNRDSYHDKSNALPVRQHPEYGPYVEGLKQILVEDYKTIDKLIKNGNKYRTTASTNMNDRSSRSHAVLTIYFTQFIEEDGFDIPREIGSKINLVDLAGSEKILASGVSGIQLEEAIQINKSLTTLSRVIHALAEQSQKNIVSTKKKKTLHKKSKKKKKKKKIHIPFRDSVLSWILKESLGGNSKTFMIANVSPSILNEAETISTLQYAQRASMIVNVVKINEDTNTKIIKTLRQEIYNLQNRLANRGSESSTTTEEIQNMKEQLKQRENLIKEKEKTWEDKIEESRRITEEVRLTLAKEMIEKQKLYEEKMERLSKEREKLQEKMQTLQDDELLRAKKIQDEMSKRQYEYQKKQSVIEKEKIVETAISLQTMYEKKLQDIQTEFNKKIKQYEKKVQENIQNEEQIELLREENKQLSKRLDEITKMLQENKKQMLADNKKHLHNNAIFRKQIQQLQARIHSMTKKSSE
jgi:hypothetical protein